MIEYLVAKELSRLGGLKQFDDVSMLYSQHCVIRNPFETLRHYDCARYPWRFRTRDYQLYPCLFTFKTYAFVNGPLEVSKYPEVMGEYA